MARKGVKKVIDPRIITVQQKCQSGPIGTAYIDKLPTEILSIVLSMAIDPSHSLIAQQWHQIYQSIVCRQWYSLRKQRTKFVFLSVLQMKAMVRLIKSKDIDVREVEEVIFDSSEETAQGKVLWFGKIIKLCPRIEVLTVRFSNKLQSMAKDRNLDNDLPILNSMKALELKHLCIISGLKRETFNLMLQSWTKLRTIDLNLCDPSSNGSADIFTLPYSLERIRIRSNLPPCYLRSVTSAMPSKLKHLQLHQPHGHESDWREILERLLPNLESLSVSFSTTVSSVMFALGGQLKSLSIPFSKEFDASAMNCLTSVSYLAFEYWIDSQETMEKLLAATEDILPITLARPLHLELIIVKQSDIRVFAAGHSIYSTALSRGIKLRVSYQRVSSFLDSIPSKYFAETVS